VIEKAEDSLISGYEKAKEFITGEPRQDETKKLEKKVDDQEKEWKNVTS